MNTDNFLIYGQKKKRSVDITTLLWRQGVLIKSKRLISEIRFVEIEVLQGNFKKRRLKIVNVLYIKNIFAFSSVIFK